MAPTQFNSFERVFPNREFLGGKPLKAVLWGVFASFALCLLMVDVFLIADLLETAGKLDVPLSERSQLYEYLTPAGESARPALDGLSTTAWRLRNVPVVGPSLRQAYRRIAWLHDPTKSLMLLVLTGFLIACAQGFCRWRAQTTSTGAALDVATRLRRTLHRQTLRLGPGDLTDPEGTQVIGLFTTEVDQVSDGIQTWIYRLGSHSTQIAFLVLLALAVQWRVALQCIMLLAGCWYLVQRQRARFATVRKLEESRAERRLRLLAEGLRKTRIVRGYGMEDFEHEQFQRHLEKFRSHLLHVLNNQHYLRLAVGSLVLMCVAGMTFLVGSKVLQPSELASSLSFSTALVMLAIVATLPRPLTELWDLRNRRLHASQAADRIYRYLNEIPAVSQAVGAKFLDPLSRHIHFEAVSYTLPGKKRLLDGLDLKLDAAQVIALVSFDPLEARALACMLPRFIEPQSGRVMFDGEDIAWGTLESLRAEAAYVGGSDPFFTGTVADNIVCSHSSYGLPELTEAAKTAHAHNFILRLPQGYETMIGEHGEQLDPGQGFRLGLARAVLRDPALMIIEEPSEAMDEDTKSLLDDSYNRIVRNRTVIFLPNRLSTLRRADWVVFLHRGKVESQGTYHDLVKESSLFRHWEYVHFNQFRRELEPAAAAR